MSFKWMLSLDDVSSTKMDWSHKPGAMAGGIRCASDEGEYLSIPGTTLRTTADLKGWRELGQESAG